MADAIAICPELPFKQQILEYVQFLARSLPSSNDGRDLLAPYETQLKLSEGQTEITDEQKRSAVRSLVEKTMELKAGLEAPKESETESSHMLLQYLLSSNFDQASPEYEALEKSVIDSIQKSAETAAGEERTIKVETACRMLNNLYNYLPSRSSLRSSALLALLTILSLVSELSALTLTVSSLSSAVEQWSLPSSEKVKFLTSASSIYSSSGDLSKAFELHILALDQAGGTEVVDQALALAMADGKRFSLDEVLRVPGAREKASLKMGELLSLFEGDEVEAVEKGKEWTGANKQWFEAFGIPQLSPEGVLRKLRFIALASLASRSTTQQVQYSEVASALLIDEAQVESIAIEAIRLNILKARLSQPTATIRITSVSSLGSRNFGASEWQLLERRMMQWKAAVAEARSVIEEAESIVAQGPITHRNRVQTLNRRDEEIAA